MRPVEELVRRKLEKRALDALSPKPDPYELRAPQGCSLLFPTATQTEGNQSGQTLLSQNPTGVKLQRRWSSNTVSIGVKSTAQIFGPFGDQKYSYLS